MSKTVQIPQELFFELCRFHLTDTDSLEEWEVTDLLQTVENGLKTKLEAMQRRALYSAYKDTKASPEARQEARKAYLDMVGMLPGYRWETLEPPQ